jgi:hypothetical protein
MRSKLFGDHRAHAEQARALGGPVARAAGAVLLAGDDEQRHALLLVRSEASKMLVCSPSGRWMVTPPLDVGHQAVAQPHVGEGAAHHHLVVAAPRAVGV